MKLKNTKELDDICEKLLKEYSTHIQEGLNNNISDASISFLQGKYEAIYELLRIIDSPLWYKLHSEEIDKLR